MIYLAKNKITAMRDLEQIDIKILKALLRDGRTNFTDIAKNCQTSDKVIWKHFIELKRSDIIVGSTIEINVPKLGFDAVAMIMMNVESQNVEDVCSRLQKILFLNGGAFKYYNSIYNVAAIVLLKNLRDLENVKQSINRQNQINDFKTYIWTDCRNIPENIFSDPDCDISDVTVPTKAPTYNLDAVDQKIIDALMLNGRLTFNRLGQQIGVSTATVSRRYEKLKMGNYIKAVIQFNPLEVGFQNILEISLALADQSEVNRITDKLSKIPGVSYIVKISGNFDLSAVALVKDCKDIIRINDEILKIPHIKKMEGTLRRIPPVWPGPHQYISTF